MASRVLCLVALLGYGCGPAPSPTPVGSGGSLSIGCPPISDPPPSCPGFAITGATLACSSPPVVGFAKDNPKRIVATVATGSTVTATARPASSPPGEPCHGIGASSRIVVTFGLEYLGDIGPNTPICIRQSKITYTQFQVGGDLNESFNPTIQGQITGPVLMTLDDEAVKFLGGPAGSPRCSDWRLMP